MRIQFFANLSRHENWQELFRRVEFYRVDLQLLRELGHEVIETGLPSQIDWSADLYYGWWWGHAPFIMLPAKLRGKPIILTGAFDYATCREELPGASYLDRPWWQRAIMSLMLRMADTNLFISQYEHDEVTSHLRVRRPIALPLAIDTGYYRPGPAMPASDFFFAVSLQTRENAIRKGLPQSIEAFARVSRAHPNLRFVIAGKPGDYQDALAKRAERLGVGDKVEFIGMISETEKLDCYHRCIAYVQPTLYEGFGHAIGEAVASGAQVVSASRGAVPEVTGGFARLVDPKDVGAIATAMTACLERPLDEEEKAAQHRWITEQFGLDVRRERLRQIIDSYV